MQESEETGGVFEALYEILHRVRRGPEESRDLSDVLCERLLVRDEPVAPRRATVLPFPDELPEAVVEGPVVHAQPAAVGPPVAVAVEVGRRPQELVVPHDAASQGEMRGH